MSTILNYGDSFFSLAIHPCLPPRFSTLHNQSRFLKEMQGEDFLLRAGYNPDLPAKAGSLRECDGIDENLGKSTMVFALRSFILFSLQDVLTQKKGIIHYDNSISFPISLMGKSNEVWKALRKLTGYLIAVLTIDPIYLGAAQKRRRIYIVLVHHSVARADLSTHGDLQTALEATLQRMVSRTPVYPNPCLGLS